MSSDFQEEQHESSAPAGVSQDAGGDAAPRGVITGKKEPVREEIPNAPEIKQEEPAPRSFEYEIWRLEARGRQGVIVGYPQPLPSAHPKGAIIDWLSFTLKPSTVNAHLWVMRELDQVFGFREINERKSGLVGYQFSAIIEGGGLMAWGGKNQNGTIYVSLNAHGCHCISDFVRIADWIDQYHAKVTRVDLAYDDFEGKIVTIDAACEWTKKGGFSLGGCPPSVTVAGDWIFCKKGRTLYIGGRSSGKVCRIYEKGKQIGDLESPWCRIEVEWHDKHYVLKTNMLRYPGQYLAGGYPCLNFISENQCALKSERAALKIDVERVVYNARQAVGKAVNFLLQFYGGDYAKVIEVLRRDGVPARLDPYCRTLRDRPEVLQWLEAQRDAALVNKTGR